LVQFLDALLGFDLHLISFALVLAFKHLHFLFQFLDFLPERSDILRCRRSGRRILGWQTLNDELRPEKRDPRK
jgi:hypothetical protein